MSSPELSIQKPVVQKKNFKRNKRLLDIYSRGLLTKKVCISINNVGGNIKETLETKVSSMIEGKCIPEGYIKPDSVKLLTYSSGKIKNGNFIEFDVVFECQVCFPVEGMLIECKSINITKAGIKAEIEGEESSPVIIFIARDHHYMTPYFSTITENQDIKIRVIGQRFELNDKFISILGELIEPVESKKLNRKKPRLVLSNEDEVLTIKPKRKKKPKLVLEGPTE